MSLLTEQFLLLSPLVYMLIGLTLLVGYVAYSTDRKFKLKFTMGPVLLIIAVFSFVLVGSQLGYPYPMKLPQDFQYVGHRVLHDEREKTWIDLMIVTKGETRSRLIKVPYSKSLEKALQKAQEAQKDGGPQGVRRKGKDGEAQPGNDDTPGEFEAYNLPPPERYLKEPEEGPMPSQPGRPARSPGVMT